MSIKTRRALFFVCLALFCIVGALLILYTQGYTIDLDHFIITKTGALYLDFKQDHWKGFLNYKLIQEQPRLLSGGVFIRNLPPKLYTVKIEKPGFLTWIKTVKVSPALVAVAANLFLVPDTLPALETPEAADVKKFWISQDSMLYQDNQGALHYIYRDQTAPLKGTSFMKESKNQSKFITSAVKNGKITYYLYDKRSLEASLNLSLLFQNLASRLPAPPTLTTTITEVIPHAFDADKWILDTPQGLFMIDANHLDIVEIEREEVTAAMEGPNALYYYGPRVGLVRYDFILKTKKKLFDAIEKETVVEIGLGAERHIILRSRSGNLYSISGENQNSLKLAHSVTGFTFTNDLKKLAYVDKDGTLNIYFISDFYGLFQKKAGEVLQITPPSGFIPRSLVWYKNSNYLVAISDHAALLIEIDDNGKSIFYDLSAFDSSFYYDGERNVFFFDKNKKIYSSQVE